jgi:hypothetical protein
MQVSSSCDPSSAMNSVWCCGSTCTRPRPRRGSDRAQRQSLRAFHRGARQPLPKQELGRGGAKWRWVPTRRQHGWGGLLAAECVGRPASRQEREGAGALRCGSTHLDARHKDLRRGGARRLPGRFHPHLRDQNRGDIGKSQSQRTAAEDGTARLTAAASASAALAARAASSRSAAPCSSQLVGS